MKFETYLAKFGVVAARENRPSILVLLDHHSELERASQGAGDTELMRLLAVHLFSLGVVEDVLAIWSAKTSSSDSHASIDVQLLCGAGLETTRAFLADSTESNAKDALEYINKSLACGDFDGFSPSAYLADMREYYDQEGAK